MQNFKEVSTFERKFQKPRISYRKSRWGETIYPKYKYVIWTCLLRFKEKLKKLKYKRAGG